MTKVLITGVAGGIASHLAKRCLEEDWIVYGVDDLSAGNKKNMSQIIDHKNFHFILGDINDIENLLASSLKIDYILHLAGNADIVDSIANPKDYFNSNVSGTMAIMEYARKNKIKKVIYAASSSCYGIPDEYPTKETSEIRCEYPYAWSKNSAKELIEHYGKVYGIPYINLVLFNVYSPYCKPNNNYGAVFKVFLRQYIDNKPFTIIGNGKQKRDFVHVDDVAYAFIKSIESKVENETINIGANNPKTINYLARLIGGWGYLKEYLPWRKGEPKITHADISKAVKLLNWRPEITFESGILEIMQNLDNYKDAPLWDKESILKKQKEWLACIGK